MSFGIQDGRSHPRVRRFEGDLVGSKWGVKIDESAEDTVVLLSQSGGTGFISYAWWLFQFESMVETRLHYIPER